MNTLEQDRSRPFPALESGAVAEALARERRQLAADVHDLVMQDLALAISAARTLLEEPAVAPEMRAVVLAGERALNGAREVVAQCARRGVEPVTQALRTAVRVAARGVPLKFDVSGVGACEQPDAPTCSALIHIGREAVRNAAKHADPSAIEVVLEHEEEWLLRIHDDGCGLARDAGGFGLPSMRQAATALGGSLRIVSIPGRGTTLVAALP